MQTVFSHIVQMRLSQESENVATEALAFIPQSSEAAQAGMMKMLREIVPELPSLWFRAQQTAGNIRPDMWGLDETAPAHVFVENKFWAGLTDTMRFPQAINEFIEAEAWVFAKTMPEWPHEY